VLAYALVKTTRPTAVHLSATSLSGPLTFEVPLDRAHRVTGRTVATLAARTRIRELEESTGSLHARGSQQKERKRGVLSTEIVELSIRYGLISRETSFVAVERRDTPVLDAIQLRRVPIALTSGWGGGSHEAWCLTPGMPTPSLPLGVLDETYGLQVRGVSLPLGVERPAGVLPDDSNAPRRAGRRGILARFRHAWLAAARPAGMDALVALQAADGSWDLTAQLAAILGRRLPEIETALPGASGAEPLMRKAWATALALAWLELHASALEDEWHLLGTKARKWIDEVAAVSAGWIWVGEARRFLSS
jgi:Ca-activated chloride channel family protein